VIGAEMAAAVKALTDAQAALLIRYGVDPVDISLGMVGCAPIRLERGTYVPDPDGKVAFITPVRVDDPLSAVRVGDLVDLIAWHPLRPGHFALRIGVAEWLGAIEPQHLDPPPVPVRRSVLAWFQHGCTGLVPLSREPRDVYRLLGGIGRLEAEDDAHRAELRAVLQRPWPTPAISVARRLRHAA